VDLRATILAAHSKAQTEKIVQYVLRDRKRFNELAKIFLTGDALEQQRAGWPLSYCVEQKPEWILPHLGKLVKLLERRDVHNAVTRNIVRALQYVTIPQNYQGEVMNNCFALIEDPKQLAAIKAFSLTVLEKLAVHYPDIIPELKLIIEERWPHETPAFHSRARNILKRFS